MGISYKDTLVNLLHKKFLAIKEKKKVKYEGQGRVLFIDMGQAPFLITKYAIRFN